MEQDDSDGYVCSSSSADSVAGGSDDAHVYEEEIVSGYVAVSLLKKYRKPTKQPQVKVKRALFVRVLSRMKAVDQPGEPDSVLDYTRLWSDLIDRGGLYHINDEVCI